MTETDIRVDIDITHEGLAATLYSVEELKTSCQYCDGDGVAKESHLVGDGVPDEQTEVINETVDPCPECDGDGRVVLPDHVVLDETHYAWAELIENGEHDAWGTFIQHVQDALVERTLTLTDD